MRSAIGIVRSNELEGPGFGYRSNSAFSSPQRPDKLCGPPSLLFNGNRLDYRGRNVCWPLSTILLPRPTFSGNIHLIPSIPAWQTLVQLYFWAKLFN